MPALVYNHNLEQGVTFKRLFRWIYADGSDRDLNNWRSHMQVRPGYGLPTVLNLTTENGGIILAGSIITILITKEMSNSLIIPVVDSKQVPKITYYYDLFLFDLNNESKKFMKGSIFATGAITHDN